MSQEDNRLKYIFIISYVLSRLIIILTPGFLWDHTTYFPPIFEFLQGRSPYITLPNSSTIYPPLFYFIIACFIFVFGLNSFAFGMCFLTFDVGTVLLLYKIAPSFYQQKSDYWKPLFFFSFFPITLSIELIGLPPGIAIFFFTAAVYCLVKNKPFFMGVFAAIGFLIEIYPIFLLYVVCIIYLARKQFKNLLLSLLGFIPTALVLVLPFFNFDILSATSLILIHFTRDTSTSLQLFLPQVSFTIFLGISINLYSILAVIGIIALGIWIFTYARQAERIDNRKIFEILIFFFLFFPILLLNLYPRYFYWCLPLLGNLFNFSTERTFQKRFLGSNLLACLGFSIFLNIFLPNGVFRDLSNFPNLCSDDPPLLYYLIAIEIFLLVVIAIWLFNWGKLFNPGEMGSRDFNLFRSLTNVMLVFLALYWIEVPIYFFNNQDTTAQIILVGSFFLVFTCIALILLAEELFKFYKIKFSKQLQIIDRYITQ